jgi:hypothetical protein
MTKEELVEVITGMEARYYDFVKQMEKERQEFETKRAGEMEKFANEWLVAYRDNIMGKILGEVKGIASALDKLLISP